MYTIKQIRDLFYGLMNQSAATDVQEVHSDDIALLKKKCTQLGMND